MVTGKEAAMESVLTPPPRKLPGSVVQAAIFGKWGQRPPLVSSPCAGAQRDGQRVRVSGTDTMAHSE